MSIALPQKRIGPRPPVDRFLGDPDRLGVLPACRMDEGLRLSRESLRPRVLRVAELAPLLRELLRFVEAAERGEDAAQLGRVCGQLPPGASPLAAPRSRCAGSRRQLADRRR